MKKSISSCNNREINSSRPKRMRSSTPIQEKENMENDGYDESLVVSSLKKVKAFTSQTSKGKKLSDTTNLNDSLTTAGSTPSGSSISFTTSAKGLTTANNSQTTSQKCNNASTESKEKHRHAVQRIVDDSVISQKNKSQKISNQVNEKSNISNTNVCANENLNRPSSSQLKTATSPMVNRKHISSQVNSSQIVDVWNSSRSTNASLPPSPNDLNSSRRTALPVCASVEGSLEYRELKRLYIHEKHQCAEWKKDYMILKRHLEKLKSTSIPTPSASVLEWLQELLCLIDTKAGFAGDGRDLKEIGEELGLDEASLLTATARTPQKTALKIFRLLFPTLASRAKCVSISQVPKKLLDNIYMHARILHKNLCFDTEELRRAIGTSIRNAKRDLRIQQERTSVQQNQGNADIDDDVERTMDETMNSQTTLNNTEYAMNECDHVIGDDDEHENEDDDEDIINDDTDDEDDDKDINNLMIDEELDEDDE